MRQVLGAHRDRAEQSTGQIGCCSPSRTAVYFNKLLQIAGIRLAMSLSCAAVPRLTACPHSKPPPSRCEAQPCSHTSLGTASPVLEGKNLGCCSKTVAEGQSAELLAEQQPRYRSSDGNDHKAHRKGQLPRMGPGVSPEACSGRAYPFPLHAPRAGERLKCHSK